jgi:hypothetical protein
VIVLHANKLASGKVDASEGLAYVIANPTYKRFLSAQVSAGVVSNCNRSSLQHFVVYGLDADPGGRFFSSSFFVANLVEFSFGWFFG